MKRIFFQTILFLVCLASPSLAHAYYTDLVSAPVGAYVTVYDIDSAVSSWPIHSHGTNGSGVAYTIVQVPDAVTPLTVGGQSIPVEIITGRVIEATTATIDAVFTAMIPGDTVYLRAGTYDGHYGPDAYWAEANFIVGTIQGTLAQPIALIAYPGEAVTLDNTGPTGGGRPNFSMGAPDGDAAYMTIAGFNLLAVGYNIAGGGNTTNDTEPESGGHHIRVVGNSMAITDTTTNTMTGLLSTNGDGWKVLGNTFSNPPTRDIINNNHGIYIQNGSDDVEVAYNQLLNLRMGFAIQVHQDGVGMLYDNVWIHHNLLQNPVLSDARGINVGGVNVASTVLIENNTLINCGQGFGAVTVYTGQVQIRNNTFNGADGGAIMLNGGGDLSFDGQVWESGNTYTNVSPSNYYAVNGASLSDIVHEASSDTTAPTITSISSSATNGTYNQGDIIDIDVTFSEAVTSTGSVTVTLETGTTDRTCTFTISSSTTGTCNYTVQAGDTSSDLTVNSIAGVVNDASSNPMTTPTTPTTNLAANKALVIDTLAPGAPSGLVVN